jgi:hypothetical protein
VVVDFVSQGLPPVQREYGETLEKNTILRMFGGHHID